MGRLLLISPSELKNLDLKILSSYNYIGVGSEFCQNQIPNINELNVLLRKSSGLIKKIIVATSIMTDKGLKMWMDFFEKLKILKISNEVIINDFGLLYPLKDQFKIYIGRIMARDFFNISKDWAIKFFKNNNIVGIEADTMQLYRDFLRFEIPILWHRKHSFVAITTYCPFERHFRNNCNKSCVGKNVILNHKDIKYPLFLYEKAYLKENKTKIPLNVSIIVDSFFSI